MILADALALADEEAPDLMFDFATLTGAARVALGPDLPPFYTDDEALAAEIAHHAVRVRDPVWRMPLWRPYETMLEGRSPISTIRARAPVRGLGDRGAVPAALRRQAKSWAHFDVYAWNPKPRAHGPQGGEIQAARALFDLLSERYPRLSAIQISHPDAALAYDLDKDQAIQSRKRILDMAATERFAIAGAHVNAPGFGYVVRKGASFAFEPAGN